jgi:hypothetical protein
MAHRRAMLTPFVRLLLVQRCVRAQTRTYWRSAPAHTRWRASHRSRPLRRRARWASPRLAEILGDRSRSWVAPASL